MSIREKPIYISNEVGRWLWLLSKAESGISYGFDGITRNVEDRKITPDEIADQLLRQTIRELHPQLAEHQKKTSRSLRKI